MSQSDTNVAEQTGALAPRHHHPRKVLRCSQVEQKLGLCTSAIYAKATFNPKRPNDYDPTFPKSIPLGAGRAVGWLEHELDAWVDAQAAKRNAQAEPSATPKPQPRHTARKTGGG